MVAIQLLPADADTGVQLCTGAAGVTEMASQRIVVQALPALPVCGVQVPVGTVALCS